MKGNKQELLFEILPDEINIEILEYLPVVDLLFSIANVCKSWRKQAFPVIMKIYKEFKSTMNIETLQTPITQSSKKILNEINQDRDEYYEILFKERNGQRFIKTMLRKFIYQVTDRWIESKLVGLEHPGFFDLTNLYDGRIDNELRSELDLIVGYFSYFSDLQSVKKEVLEKIDQSSKLEKSNRSCGNSVFTGIFQFLTSYFGSVDNPTTIQDSKSSKFSPNIPIKFGSNQYNFKCSMAGDSNCGKTSFINCIVYYRSYDQVVDSPTIGASFFSKSYKFSQEEKYNLQMWDVYGPERYRSLTLMHYRNVHVVFLLFDLTDKRSFEHASLWYDELKKWDAHQAEVVLIGNKIDLLNRVCVKKEEAQKMAFEHMNGSLYVETTNSDIRHAHKVALYSMIVKYCIMRNCQ